MNLLFVTDRFYMEHAADCIRSVIRFPCREGYDIYILHSDLGEREQEQFVALAEKADVRLHFRYVDPSMFEVFPESGRYPRQIYYRIFAASLLPPELERILYLDADTVIINPLQELYEMDFGGNCILACTHVRKFLNKVNQYRLGMETERAYINSGVMLMNLRALRERQNVEEVVSYMKKRRRRLTLPDQDIITALYGDRIGLLDTMRYNLSDRILAFYNLDHAREKRDLAWVRKNGVIIHYCGKQKPWKSPYFGILDVFYHENQDALQVRAAAEE